MNSIGKRIRTLRKERQMSLEDLAKFVGTSRQTIQRYETAVITNIPSDKIELMAAALQTTPDIIMGWTTKESTSELPTKEGTEEMLYKVLVHYGILGENEKLTNELLGVIVPTVKAITDAMRNNNQ